MFTGMRHLLHSRRALTIIFVVIGMLVVYQLFIPTLTFNLATEAAAMQQLNKLNALPSYNHLPVTAVPVMCQIIGG
jgi:hypothetical protein